MARNASGAYTLPTGNPVVTDTTVTSTWANATMIDVATEMTASLSRTGKGGMLAPLKTINGTAGAPVYTFTNFPTSGWYIAGAGDVRMSITGTDRLKVLATGIEVAGSVTADNTILVKSNGANYNGYMKAANSVDMFTIGATDSVTGNELEAALIEFTNFGAAIGFKTGKTSSSASLPATALTIGADQTATFTQNIVMAASKTVDGRDVSVDGAKLDNNYAGTVPVSTGTGTVSGNSGFTYSWAGNSCTITHNLNFSSPETDACYTPSGLRSDRCAFTMVHNANNFQVSQVQSNGTFGADRFCFQLIVY
jgi:hypothetical protein